MSGGIYQIDGKKYYGDGREVNPSPGTSEEVREACLQRLRLLVSSYGRDPLNGDPQNGK